MLTVPYKHIHYIFTSFLNEIFGRKRIALKQLDSDQYMPVPSVLSKYQ